jgi:dihydrodipicolinate synthase/N-acetylneuraminate lyase
MRRRRDLLESVTVSALDDYIPRPGLSIPLVTILDPQGRVLEEQQRALVRFAIQNGRGADVIFAVGTTGEWDRLDNRRRQQALQVSIDECRRVSMQVGRKVEAWAGITARTGAEVLENLERAMELEADAVVIAPLSIADSASPVDFVERDMARVFERRGAEIPTFLYDNADIAAPGKSAHMHTRDVKRLARLSCVRGVKVTAGKAVLGNYTRAASHFKLAHEFAIYAGDAYVMFDLFAPAEGVASALRHRWNRYLTQRSMPYGIVAGAANVLPREWQRAWRVCRAGNSELMRRYHRALERYRTACNFPRSERTDSPAIACHKAALKELGVIDSDAVASGTPALEAAERREFAARLRAVRACVGETLEAGWQTEFSVRPASAGPARAARPNG